MDWTIKSDNTEIESLNIDNMDVGELENRLQQIMIPGDPNRIAWGCQVFSTCEPNCSQVIAGPPKPPESTPPG